MAVLEKGIARFLGFSAAIMVFFAISLGSAAVSSAADAPVWSQGFPRLVEKKALLQWDPVDGSSEYKVYRTETKDKDLKLIATVKPNRHIDNDLPAGKKFFYYVSAVVDGKEGPRSVASPGITTKKEVVFVPLKAPEIAGGHVKELADKISIGIRWEGGAGTELIGYNVYRSAKKDSGYAMIGSSSTDSFEDTDIKRGEAYYYAVTAVDSNFNETDRSKARKVDVPLPAAPKEQAATEKAEVKPTKMRPAKLLFRMPGDDESGRRVGQDELDAFRNIQDVAVDEAVGHIYITSLVYGGVLVYDMDGSLQFTIRKDGVDGNEKFRAIRGVAVGDRGNIYVSDYGAPEIMVFDFKGRPVDTIRVDIRHIPIYSSMVARNFGIATDPADGSIYVCDPVSNSVHAYSREHKLLYDILGATSQVDADKYKNKELFNGPTFITLTRDKEVVFVDSGYSKIMVYGPGGKFKRSFGKPGMGAGLLYYPSGVATGNDGEIFSASSQSPNIQAFNSKGEFLYALCNEKCDGALDVANMRGIWVDSRNRLYVAESTQNRVSVFQLEDKFVEVTPEE